MHDVGFEDGTHFIVQEWLQGKSLRDAISAGPVPMRKVLALGTEIAEGLGAAHRAGIKRIILPERTMADLEEVPQEVRDDMEFVPVTKMDEVLLEALETPEKLDIKRPKPAKEPKKKSSEKTAKGRITENPSPV